ncbi:MAG: threonine/serine exporter family protein [Tannerellaceae bacterium]|nr:threonine/serine exporter family protein [Tannerellaceae bacterium]
MPEKEDKSLEDATLFMSEYIATLMGSGVHTSRVVRNSRRMAESLGLEMQLSVFHRTVILNMEKGCYSSSKIVEVPTLPINFRYNSELSGLSWEAFDRRLPLEEIRSKYEKIVSAAPLNHNIVMLMAASANASFCRLFSGDWLSTLIVFIAAIVGFRVRRILTRRHTDFHLTILSSAFLVSLIASSSLLFNTTADIAITTSVLYLIPGVPLINGVIDIVEGYILCGFARLTKAMLIIFCIAIGLSLTLWIVKNGLI